VLTQADVRPTVLKEIQDLLLESSDEVVTLNGTETLHDIALDSLLLARLVVQMEAAVGVDPFAREEAAIADMRTVNDLVAAYEKGLANTVDSGAAPGQG
jgi:acyl carrier protein